MKVKELIDRLKEMPEDAPVHFLGAHTPLYEVGNGINNVRFIEYSKIKWESFTNKNCIPTEDAVIIYS